ncbi:hypothetical protein VTJ49DRAFT_1555 [Mycothermus thermophilus]|uniref:Uncharacterized protein n=1 Tax=Humicola insolens TaxID=85995 RepID=A0ABR3VPR8_HUMIN
MKPLSPWFERFLDDLEANEELPPSSPQLPRLPEFEPPKQTTPPLPPLPDLPSSPYSPPPARPDFYGFHTNHLAPPHAASSTITRPPSTHPTTPTCQPSPASFFAAAEEEGLPPKTARQLERCLQEVGDNLYARHILWKDEMESRMEKRVHQRVAEELRVHTSKFVLQSIEEPDGQGHQPSRESMELAYINESIGGDSDDSNDETYTPSVRSSASSSTEHGGDTRDNVINDPYNLTDSDDSDVNMEDAPAPRSGKHHHQRFKQYPLRSPKKYKSHGPRSSSSSKTKTNLAPVTPGHTSSKPKVCIIDIKGVVVLEGGDPAEGEDWAWFWVWSTGSEGRLGDTLWD